MSSPTDGNGNSNRRRKSYTGHSRTSRWRSKLLLTDSFSSEDDSEILESCPSLRSEANESVNNAGNESEVRESPSSLQSCSEEYVHNSIRYSEDYSQMLENCFSQQREPKESITKTGNESEVLESPSSPESVVKEYDDNTRNLQDAANMCANPASLSSPVQFDTSAAEESEMSEILPSPHGSSNISNDEIENTEGSLSHNESGSASTSESSTVTTSDSESEYFPSSDNESFATDSDDFSSDLECFQAYYLEEDQNQNDNGGNIANEENYEDRMRYVDLDDPDNPDDPDDPDDPDNPDDPGNPGEGRLGSDESDEEDVAEVATFNADDLNVNVRMFQNLTKGQVLCLQLASAVRHRMTFENILEELKNLNVLFGPHCFPESKTKLWSAIMLNKAGVQFHVYCGNKPCGRYLGKRDRFVNVVRCGMCQYEVPVRKAKFFVSLDLKSQIKYFLAIPGIWEKLQYPQTRQKFSETAIEDILDGAHYLRLKEAGQPLADPHNFSYVFSMDGVNATKKGSLKVTPIYIRINELPPELRQKFHFLAAIFIDNKEPNMKCYLKPFVRQASRLARQGLNWKPDGNNDINSKFIPLAFCVDSPIRYEIMCLSKWDSEFGCTYCDHRGIREAGSHRYPFVNVHNIPAYQDRSHAGMVAAMEHVQQNPQLGSYKGHKGVSSLILLEPYLDLREGQAQDDLHQDHEGSAADVTELLLTTQEARINGNLPNAALWRIIDNRMLSIQTPSRISRKPRSITKRSTYSGSEWRNWLFYYSIPCLLGVIKPEYLDILAALSHACYLLSQDSIEEEDIVHAERLLHQVATRFENTFGVGRLKYNFHVTTMHKVRSVRNLGNPFAYSTYNFESLHRKVIGKVTSPKGAIMQIITRSLLYLTVHASQYDERLPEDVRLRVEDILNPYQLKKVRQVGHQKYVIGRGTERELNVDEARVMRQEGILVQEVVEYSSVSVGSTRYWSCTAQNQQLKSNDSFVYTTQDTYCTVQNIVCFTNDNGEEMCGAFVIEHDVARVVPVARHLSMLQNDAENLFHFISLDQVRCPAVKMSIQENVFVASVPNCIEID